MSILLYGMLFACSGDKAEDTAVEEPAIEPATEPAEEPVDSGDSGDSGEEEGGDTAQSSGEE
jgi:hypothetical protein